MTRPPALRSQACRLGARRPTPCHLGAALLVGAALLLVPALGAAKTVVCPGPVTLDGIDVSYWQLDIDWDKVKAAGKKYAIMRAANGLKGDTKFAYNWKRCHELGLRCGVYQYFQPDIDVIQQADLMLSIMGKLQPGDLPPVIDVEHKGNSTPASLSAAVGKWIDYVQAKTGRQPMIYTGGYFWEDNVKSTAFVDYPLWHAQYCSNCCPNIAHPWKKWAFWQYSSTGKVSGINGNVDLNHFNGNAAALDALAQVKACTPGCKGSIITDAECNQGDCATFGAYCSTVAAATPKCVSAFCAKSADSKPTAGDVCLPDGSRATCSANGDITAKPCPVDTSCTASGGAAVCAPTTCKPSCNGNKLVAADCAATDCASLPGPSAGSCVQDAKGARCKAAACPALGVAAVCLPDPKHLAMGLCQDGAVTVSQCLAGSQVCATAPGTPAIAACADIACAPDPAAKLVPSTACQSPTTLRICDEFGQLALVDCQAGQACVQGATEAACAKPGGGQGDAGSSDGGGADASGSDAGSSDGGGNIAEDGAGDVAAPDEDPSADGVSRGDDAGRPGGDAGRPGGDDGASDDGGLSSADSDGVTTTDVLGDAGAAPDAAATAGPPRAPEGGCSVRSAASGALGGPGRDGAAPAWVAMLCGSCLALLRRRQRTLSARIP